MKQTTIRLSEGLWRLVEQEADRAGVSVAHFIREATLARAAYTAGQRGDGLTTLFDAEPEPGSSSVSSE